MLVALRVINKLSPRWNVYVKLFTSAHVRWLTKRVCDTVPLCYRLPKSSKLAAVLTELFGRQVITTMAISFGMSPCTEAALKLPELLSVVPGAFLLSNLRIWVLWSLIISPECSIMCLAISLCNVENLPFQAWLLHSQFLPSFLPVSIMFLPCWFRAFSALTDISVSASVLTKPIIRRQEHHHLSTCCTLRAKLVLKILDVISTRTAPMISLPLQCIGLALFVCCSNSLLYTVFVRPPGRPMYRVSNCPLFMHMLPPVWVLSSYIITVVPSRLYAGVSHFDLFVQLTLFASGSTFKFV